MDPELQTLGLQLADAAIRNTASSVVDRIKVAKARKKDPETIAELEEVVSDLLADKAELQRIAQAFEEELVAQRISGTDIEYITDSILPKVEELIEQASGGVLDESTRTAIDGLKAVLSVETLTVLQLIGFNIRRAIGEPLTQLVANLIEARGRAVAGGPSDADLQSLKIRYELAFLNVVQDPDASSRFRELTGRPPQNPS